MSPGSEQGGSQPHLFDTSGGRYMVKAQNNPQGMRVLVNELTSGLCLEWLGVVHPPPAIIDVTPDAVSLSNGLVRFNDGQPFASGLSFGSEYWQSEPQGTVSPDLIVNRKDVAGVWALDTWIKPHDGRQYRLRASGAATGRYDFIPVDQGHSFGSPQWDAAALNSQQNTVTLAPDPGVPVGRDDLRPFATRLRTFDRETAMYIVQQVPSLWLDDTDRAALIEYLFVRAPFAAQLLENKP